MPQLLDDLRPFQTIRERRRTLAWLLGASALPLVTWPLASLTCTPRR